jgi:hypothetical protein
MGASPRVKVKPPLLMVPLLVSLAMPSDAP